MTVGPRGGGNQATPRLLAYVEILEVEREPALGRAARREVLRILRDSAAVAGAESRGLHGMVDVRHSEEPHAFIVSARAVTSSIPFI